MRNNFELQGVSEKVLDTKTYTAIINRFNVEEANQALRWRLVWLNLYTVPEFIFF